MKQVSAIVALLCLSACVPAGNYYRVSDGLRVDASPSLLQSYQADRAACEGEGGKAALAAGNDYNLTQRELVVRGCMADRSYVVR